MQKSIGIDLALLDQLPFLFMDGGQMKSHRKLLRGALSHLLKDSILLSFCTLLSYGENFMLVDGQLSRMCLSN